MLGRLINSSQENEFPDVRKKIDLSAYQRKNLTKTIYIPIFEQSQMFILKLLLYL